jgi:hypothetical protein
MHEEVLLVYLANVMCIAIKSDKSAKLNKHFSSTVMCLALLHIALNVATLAVHSNQYLLSHEAVVITDSSCYEYTHVLPASE